jgi:hypothetical protein
METPSQSPFIRYAIIEALRSEAAPELFVISYRNENALRLVIADFCIVATGFASREEALQLCEREVHSAA